MLPALTEVVRHDVDAPALELRGSRDHPIGGQPVVRVGLGEPAVLEQEAVVAEPQREPVADEQLPLLREALLVPLRAAFVDVLDLLAEALLSLRRAEVVLVAIPVFCAGCRGVVSR